MGSEVVDCILRLREKRADAVKDANSLAIWIARLDDDMTFPHRRALQMVERMFSHNVQVLEDVIEILESEDLPLTGELVSQEHVHAFQQRD
jgi:hypothetical protein